MKKKTKKSKEVSIAELKKQIKIIKTYLVNPSRDKAIKDLREKV